VISPLLARAQSLLAEGKVVGVPTDTVYGLATQHCSQGELFRLKGRSADKPIPVLVGSVAAAESLATLPPLAQELADAHWPGPLTLVLATRSSVTPNQQTVGLRMPDHPLALELLALSGPLAVTSANRSGQPPARSEKEAQSIFGAEVAIYLPGVCPGGVASTVIEALPERPPRILREGPVSL
jgi:tRNA threonylcarbamoyl adenosine modification protein (Sua5/YciO/YrdC/YwlC family)